MKTNTEISAASVTTKEEWLDVKGFEGLYEVSNFGRVRSIDRMLNGPFKRKKVLFKGRILKSVKSTTGYLKVSLCVNSAYSGVFIHRLVAEKFIPNPDMKPCVNHIDGNKENNIVSNLEWVTYSENNLHAYKIGLRVGSTFLLGKTGSLHHTSKAILQLDLNGNILAEFGSIKEASRMTKVNPSDISQCALGKKKHAAHFIWKHKN